jgi:O-antigen/teichoic acid export membrane protein
LVGARKFIGSSLLLFVDNIVVAASNWAYWIIVSSLTSSAEVGQATALISLVTLITTITQLGIEYPLLKKTSKLGSKVFSPALVLVVCISLSAIPLVLYVSNNVYNSPPLLGWIAVMMLSLTPIDFVSRYVLLGLSHAKAVFIIDTLGVGAKIILGYILVTNGYGSYGILLSFLSLIVVISSLTLILAVRRVKFSLKDIPRVRSLITDGLINMPSKLSGVLIFSLSVVLLAAVGIDDSQIGRFYIALMITIVGGGLLTSMAYMVLPASSMSGSDLSVDSIRMGLSLTAPLVSALLVAPYFILSLLGTDYSSAGQELSILAVGIIPFAVVMISVSRFNYLNKPRRIILLGVTQIIVFLTTFSLLVPSYGILGSSYSIVVTFISAFVVALFWLERNVIRYISKSIISVLSGSIVGYSTIVFYSNDGTIIYIVSILVSMIVTFGATLILRNTSVIEIKNLLKIVGRPDSTG